MITCGEALEMVRMAMAEAGFPDADLQCWGMESDEWGSTIQRPGWDHGLRAETSIPAGSSEPFRRAYFRAQQLVDAAAGSPGPWRCIECFIAEAPLAHCTHVEVSA